MTLKNLIRNTICVIFIAILFSTQSFSQLICELGARNNFYKNDNKDEYSGLAYLVEREIFIMPVDDPITNNIHFKGYKINASGNASFNIAISNPGTLTDADFEGLTYLKEDYFVLLEEKENKIYFIKYVDPDSGNPFFEVLSGHKTGIPQATTEPKDGLEGISYDPNTNRLYVVREHSDVRLFSIPITLPEPGFSGDIDEQQKSSVVLPANEEPSGLFHLGKVYPSSSDLSNNLLVIDDELEKIMEYKLELDKENNLFSNSARLINVIDISAEPKPEGVAVYDNKLFIASEKKSGGLSSYTVNSGAAFCNIDCTKGIIEVLNTITCACEPSTNAGCTDSNACNFDENASIDDCSCVYKNSVCDDGNLETINDRVNENCHCRGIPTCQCKHVK